jgi:hypothetical protein
VRSSFSRAAFGKILRIAPKDRSWPVSDIYLTNLNGCSAAEQSLIAAKRRTVPDRLATDPLSVREGQKQTKQFSRTIEITGDGPASTVALVVWTPSKEMQNEDR